MSALSRLFFGELSCRSGVMKAQMCVMEVVIPEREDSKMALSIPW